MMERTSVVVKAVTVGALAVACGLGLSVGCKKKAEVEYPLAQPDAGTWETTPPPQDAAVSTQDAAPVPEAAPPPTFDEVTKASLAAQIEARAATEAKFMKPVGEVFGGVASAGQPVESPVFQIDMGKCYTVIAQGGLGITELDIQLKGAQIIPGVQMTHAVDNTSGPAAAITPCWKNGYPAGFPAVVTLVARGGSGAVAARVYVK